MYIRLASLALIILLVYLGLAREWGVREATDLSPHDPPTVSEQAAEPNPPSALTAPDPKPQRQPLPPPVNAAATGDIRAIGEALESGAPVNAPDESGTTPLLAAVRAGQTAALLYLIQQGADLNIPGADGATALGMALEKDQEKIARFLLESGANADLPHRGDGLLALMIARGSPLSSLLLEIGADPDLSAGGQTPLAHALAHRDIPLARRLLEAGADANRLLTTPATTEFIQHVNDDKFGYYLRAEQGVTPLMLAAATGQIEAVQLLLAHGADRRLKTSKHGTAAIWLAATGRHTPIIQILLSRPHLPQDQHMNIDISLSRQQAVVFRDGGEILRSPISSGREGFRTPKGEYVVTNKHREWVSNLYDAPMPFFLRLNLGPIGLHAGLVPGHPASHGCIRLPEDKARAFFSTVEIGTIVRIID